MGKNDFEISLSNCRNVKSIKDGPLLIKKNTLNVFFGGNGIGKSTVGLAIRHIYEKTDETLKPLESYAFMDSADPTLAPDASCLTRIKGLHVFDDEWVSSHCFVKGTLQSDAYELYVRDADVRKLEKRRSDKLGLLNRALESDEVEVLRKSLVAVQKGLGGLKANGEFKASAPVAKAFKDGVPTEPVPTELRLVVKGMSAKEKAQWLSWHADRPVLKNESICPYCGNVDAARIDTCKSYDDSREQSEVRQWAAIANMYDSVGGVLSRGNASLLGRVLNRSIPPEKHEVDELAALADGVASALAALDGVSALMRDEEYVDASKFVPALQAKLSDLEHCGIFLKTRWGVKTAEWRAIKLIGKAVSAVVSAQADLESLTKELVTKVAVNISGHEAEINNFLSQCGYLYEVEIGCNLQTSEASVLLKPTGTKNRVLVEDPVSALSYGERNALALALFMFEAVRDPRSLVVLDDPISSFDFDKRYGILYALFTKDGGVFKQNLSGRSVLVMTHDFLVVNDLLNIPGKGMAMTKGNLLSCEDGVLCCKSLTKDAIAPYAQILKRKMLGTQGVPLIVRLVYVRQLCEMLRRGPQDKTTKEGWTFRLLSGVIHGHSVDKVMRDNGFRTRDAKWVVVCENQVERLTGTKINYWETLEKYMDCMPALVEEYRRFGRSPMEKLILVRLMIMRDGTLGEGSSIMKRFADETCHIGGSYLFQLDDGAYNQVPFYVLKWCDDVVKKAEAGCEVQNS